MIGDASNRIPWNRVRNASIPRPPFRALRGYAFDPSLSTELETELVNEVVFKVAWEDFAVLSKGPVGEYLEVVDYDPASGCFYAPVDLNDPLVLAQSGLTPSEGNPQFHQQMVYAVAMTTIRNFERALGRWAFWAAADRGQRGDDADDYVQRLRVYPHALREANAYYSPSKKALLFGYFPAAMTSNGAFFPGGIVFTCLSHDIIAHETTHALLDGMYHRFIEPTHPDALAFHEGFADIVALFQHFTFPEILRHQIAKTRGDLTSQSLLGQLAHQFGQATGHRSALRSAIGDIDPQTLRWTPHTPDPTLYRSVFAPHERGALLVAAVFDAFIAIYNTRVADLFHIASGGTGTLPAGDLHPSLVNRLVDEATKSAQHVLNACIRALDYCPPVSITFGDYLRALITADIDLVPNDERHYRVAFIQAFRRWGIYPHAVRTMSVDSLCWPAVDEELDNAFAPIAKQLRAAFQKIGPFQSRKDAYLQSQKIRLTTHRLLYSDIIDPQLLERLTGLVFSADTTLTGLRKGKSDGKPRVEVHALRTVQRIGPDGGVLNQLIIALTQARDIVNILPSGTAREQSVFRGGCTLILDLDRPGRPGLRYAIVKRIDDQERLDRQLNFVSADASGSLRATYFRTGDTAEPFALLHHQIDDGGD